MRILILGAAGSGTTTLARALSKILNYSHFDTDDYYWEKTEPPFQEKRPIPTRQLLLEEDLVNEEDWVLSGSLCGWGDKFIPMFDLVIYLWIPKGIRISRIIKREKEKHGQKIEVEGEMYQTHAEFIEYASNYDNGDLNMRSRKLHDKWLGELPCDVLRIEGDMEIDDKIEKVIDCLNRL